MSATTIKGFIARDSDGAMFFHTRKPKRYTEGEVKYWADGGYRFHIPASWNISPDVTWDSEPAPIELSLKPIVNNPENTKDRTER